MNIKVLCDDISFQNKFHCEHGLSLLIQTQNHCILFDAGQSDVFAKNAKLLGVDLSQVDIVVLSHGHYDHCNGLAHFLEINKKADIYIHKAALEEFYHDEKYIGIAPKLKQSSQRYHLLESSLDIDNEVSLYTDLNAPIESCPSMTTKRDGQLVPDLFEHEVYLICRELDNNVLFTGCSHRGIHHVVSFAQSLSVTHLVGGFHLTDNMSQAMIKDIVDELSHSGIDFYTGHCTSSVACDIMKMIAPNVFHFLGAGKQFAIGNHGEMACALFRQGYNCSQAVVGAFAKDLDMDPQIALRISCSFGGGMGRMREVCGAVSGMLMVCGMLKGYDTPETGDIKAQHYRLVQQISHEFKEQAGSIVCRELLGGSVSSLPTPTERTLEFYQKRPCERLIYLAASIAERHFVKR